MLLLLLCLGLALTATGAAISAADQSTLALDPARSRAEFEVKVIWLIGLHGDFGTVQGSLNVDRFHGQASVNARINADEVHMRSHSYENWARSAEFFDSEHYPQIHFVSEPFPLARLVSGGEIDGTLTLRGIHRQVRFELDPAACANPLDGRCPVEAGGSIRRSEYGMRSRRGTLADKVALRLSVYVKTGNSEAAP